MSKKYVLYGLRIDLIGADKLFDPIQYHVKDKLATFSSIKKAREYVENSRLKSNKTSFSMSFNTKYGYKFRAKSLLREYIDYEIKEIKETVPHDPEI